MQSIATPRLAKLPRSMEKSDVSFSNLVSIHSHSLSCVGIGHCGLRSADTSDAGTDLSGTTLLYSGVKMIRLIDQLGEGFAPTYKEVFDQNTGTWTVEVTPPKWSGLTKGASINLTADQYTRYRRWRETGAYVLPELSPSQREILMSGMDDETFQEYTRTLDDEGPEEGDEQ